MSYKPSGPAWKAFAPRLIVGNSKLPVFTGFSNTSRVGLVDGSTFRYQAETNSAPVSPVASNFISTLPLGSDWVVRVSHGAGAAGATEVAPKVWLVR